MSREIKLRAWDIEEKEMLRVQSLNFVPTFYKGRLLIKLYRNDDCVYTEGIILMQSTRTIR